MKINSDYLQHLTNNIRELLSVVTHGDLKIQIQFFLYNFLSVLNKLKIIIIS